ncbi:UNVERIFIED_CONTAM: hypothetical protein RF648_19490 [Kocuria sp. CPCC 205274]|uniref:Uncharacterized protein n=1 Tax=Herbiconiux daphne TaxID=2970914 RepID=A0ABT2H9I3_9MICO|nr:hypothetical protein [Herbiconiux daphne]MCS5736589.1 hypothetical protein [Herbiconiux daphne]
MAGKKIIKESVKPRFNSLERLAEVVDPTKMPMFLHKAKEVLVIAAKDTGKSFPVENYKVMAMELDPNAVCLTLMKHSTQAAKRGLRGINDALSKLMWDYDLPYKWEKADSFMYRMYHDKRDKLKNQAVEYNSFDNPDGLAGYTTGIGGYPFLIHIEEPVLDDGSETIDPNI